MFGLLNIYKPRGISSYDVIRQLRRTLPRKLRLGHAGTLDPLAEGVLVICLGPATRLAGLIHAWPKEYLCLARLGAVSSTDDAEGEIRPTPGAEGPSLDAVRQAAARSVGAIRQVPPAYSAVKVDGQRAYRLARRGRKVALPAKTVTVHSIEVLEYDYPRLRLRVRCGSGTYLRSLVRDLGEFLGVGGYCAELVRTAVGPFTASRAVRIEQIASGRAADFVIAPIEAVPPEARVKVTEAQVRELARGRAIEAPRLDEASARHELLGAVGPEGRLLALLRRTGAPGRLRPEKVFLQPA